jgi:hypothetical protein
MPFVPATAEPESLSAPWYGPERSLHDVAASRRSAVRGPVQWADVGNLLWHLTRQTGPSEQGRAGLCIERRVPPSAGGLHPFSLVCLSADELGAKLYEVAAHRFLPLLGDGVLMQEINAESVRAVTSVNRGCTVRFIADAALINAAYSDAETLLLRDAGVLLAMACMFAEQLGLAACPLGFLGQNLVHALGYPEERFLSLGGVQISR